MAGPSIEKYLSVFRDALNRNALTKKYSNPSIGFNWCCAFVYYCCLKAGFKFPPKPIEDYRYTLAAVTAWHHWAVLHDFFQPVQYVRPELGDIALFNNIFDDKPLDHIGVVIKTNSDGIVSAEGNNLNRTGIFERPFSVIEGYIRLPEDA